MATPINLGQTVSPQTTEQIEADEALLNELLGDTAEADGDPDDDSDNG